MLVNSLGDYVIADDGPALPVSNEPVWLRCIGSH